ncbi:MAG: LysR family transcriptional regulator substrate-binding protein, partial [Alphaproteobacteria bacterium]|nr:LysR family transcriptional regulator substrate-binding protein [Alphaproteobacteria bacterium]
VRDLLMAEHADIAIQSEPDKDAMIAQKEIVKHELLVFASKASGYLSDVSAISLKELRDLPLVSREKESYTRQIFDQLCSNHSIPIKPSITAANRESVFEIVAGGIGFGVVFSGEIPNDERITSVRLKEMDRQISDHVIYLKRKADMRIIKAFLSCIEP